MSSEPLPPLDHTGHMRLAISLAQEAPLKPDNYRVGALLFCPSTNTVLSTGYTMEVPGNTHAEQCAFIKLAAEREVPEARVGEVIPQGALLYTTVEPCVKRLSGNTSCVDRILQTKEYGDGIAMVYVGVTEPDTFVKGNNAFEKLKAAGIECEIVPGFEDEILRIATAGHQK